MGNGLLKKAGSCDFFFPVQFSDIPLELWIKVQTLDVYSFQTGQHKSLAFGEVRRKRERKKTDDLLKSDSCYFLF